MILEFKCLKEKVNSTFSIRFTIPPFDEFFFNGTKECTNKSLVSGDVPLIIKIKNILGFGYLVNVEGLFNTLENKSPITQWEDASTFYI